MTVKKTRPSAVAKDRTPNEDNAMDMYASSGQMLSVSSKDRQRMIAEAAYYIAAQRGFAGGDPTQDWIEAERQINRVLPSPKQQKDELAAYESGISGRAVTMDEVMTSRVSAYQDDIDAALGLLPTPNAV